MVDKHFSSQNGFTLIEVLVTLAILATMSLFVSQLVRSGFDVRMALSAESAVTHRLNQAMNSLSRDITHAYLISSIDSERTSRSQKRTIFKVEQKSNFDRISFTYMAHSALFRNAKEGDQAYVVYELAESKQHPGRTNLYRGEAPRVPADFKSDPPMRLLATNVAGLTIETWNGERWTRENWDTTHGETANKLPHMVRITVKVWDSEPLEEGLDNEEKTNAYSQFATVVYLAYSLDFNEVKQRNGSFRLDL